MDMAMVVRFWWVIVSGIVTQIGKGLLGSKDPIVFDDHSQSQHFINIYY